MARSYRESAGGSGLTKLYWGLGVLALLALVVVGWAAMAGGGAAMVTGPVEVEGLDDASTLVEMAQPMVLGDPEALVSILEFGDYQCPSCAAFALRVKPLVETAYVGDGAAKLLFYDFPLVGVHAHSFLAARAARCAGDQDRYWDFHETLFENQARWAGRTDPSGTFVDYAAELGLDPDAFEACLRSDRHADVVTATLRLGQELGVGSTPTVMVSRGQGMARHLAGFDFPSIQEAVEELTGGGGG